MKAFPRKPITDGIPKDSDTYKRVIEESKGMDLRDYFAAKAMQGILSGMGSADPQLFLSLSIDNYGKNDGSILTEHAYRIADAMMEARNDS